MPAPAGHKNYNINNEGTGRPKRYSKEDIERFADELLLWLKEPMNIWYKDFCLQRDIDPDYMSEWAHENERFSGVYKLAKHWQESKLVNGGLHDVLSGNIVKLVLANVHNWKTDKQETKVSGDAANPFGFILNNIDGSTKNLVKKDEK